MRYKKEIAYTAVTLLVFGFLLFLEMTLPNFARFIPVKDNALLIVVLNLNLLLILLLLFLIARVLLKSYIEKKRGIWGSGLKKRLTSTMLFISIVPSFALFILATAFFYVSMDKWFSQQIEDVFDNALTLTKYHYDDIFYRYARITDNMADEMARKKIPDNKEVLVDYLDRCSRVYFLEYLTYYDFSTGAFTRSTITKDNLDAQLVSGVKAVVRSRAMPAIIPVGDGEMLILAKRVNNETGEPRGVIFVGDKMKVKGTERILKIALLNREFKESRVFQKVLKYSFIIPLFLITILTIFVSLWMGIKMAREITVPIEKMKEGAAIIAKGRFDIALEDLGKDEISTLVKAFNSMAKELNVAKNEIEERRRYMEVILDNVATGIISTDKTGNILLLNTAAKTILGIEGNNWYGTPLRNVLGSDFTLLTKTFLREVKNAEGASVTKELRLNIKKGITYLRTSLTALKDQASKIEGFIIAFDDISHIVRAEKLATWRDVARKLTHEIKNPLTPIILSAERIRRKVLSHFSGDEKGLIDETTSVIIRSAEDIKEIVNELTKLSHISQSKTTEDVNIIVSETMDLYNNLYQNIVFGVRLEPIPPFRVDRDGLKRALINLITNSVNAMEADGGDITVKTRYNKTRGVAIIEFADTGKGIPDEDKEKVFDPYFTKEKEGTGLGLAIVHSIILEHHGKIDVEDNRPKGTRFIIELPIVEA